MLLLILNILFFSFVLFTINGKLSIKFNFYDYSRKKVKSCGAAILISIIVSIVSLFTISNNLIEVVPIHNMSNAFTIIAIAGIIGAIDDIKRMKFKLRKSLQYLIALLIALNSFAFAEDKTAYVTVISIISFIITAFLLNIFYSIRNSDNINSSISIILLASLMQLAHLSKLPIVTIISFIIIPVFISAFLYDRLPSKMNYGSSGSYIIACLFSILFSYFANIGIKGITIPLLAMSPLFADNLIMYIENKLKKGSFFISENKQLYNLMLNKTGNIFSLINYIILYIVCFLSGVITINSGIYLIAYITIIIIIPITYILRKRYL